MREWCVPMKFLRQDKSGGFFNLIGEHHVGSVMNKADYSYK